MSSAVILIGMVAVGGLMFALAATMDRDSTGGAPGKPRRRHNG